MAEESMIQYLEEQIGMKRKALADIRQEREKAVDRVLDRLAWYKQVAVHLNDKDFFKNKAKGVTDVLQGQIDEINGPVADFEAHAPFVLQAFNKIITDTEQTIAKARDECKDKGINMDFYKDAEEGEPAEKKLNTF